MFLTPLAEVTIKTNKSVRLFILREAIGRILNVHNWWGANVCIVECVMTVLVTGVLAKRTLKFARACHVEGFNHTLQWLCQQS